MDERILHFRVGVFVLVTLIITGILLMLIGKLPTFDQNNMTVYMRFKDAPGVTVSTPVRKSGILIGRVTAVDLTDDGQVLVTAEVDRGAKLNRNDFCRVEGALLGMGDATIMFAYNDAMPGDPMQDGDTIQGESPRDPFEVVRRLEPELNKMVTSVTKTSDDIGEMSRKVNSLLGDNDEQISRILTKTEQTLDGIRKATDVANQLLGDEKVQGDLRRSVADLPRVLEESRKAFAGMQETMQLANNNLKNLEGFTAPLAERTDALYDKLNKGTNKVDRLLDQLLVFSEAINDRQGSLGKLMHDPKLYDDLSDAAENIEDLTRQLRPILSDVRVITDKVARDPGRLGVSGVFRQNSGIK